MYDISELNSYIDAHVKDLVDLIRTLVSYRTDSQTEGNSDFLGEAQGCQSFLADELSRIGLEVDRFEVNSRYPAVVGKRTGHAGQRALALNGHFDVVPAGDPADWASDPWAVRQADGRLYGRGTCDMKAGIAAQIMALRALAACGTDVSGDVWIHWVSDEEVVGWSTREIVANMPRIDGIIDCEPTGLRLMPVEGGLVHLRIELDGLESHAGNRYTMLYPGPPAQGVNAIEKAMKILHALQSLERDWAKKKQHPLLPPGFNSIMPGLIFGGPGGGKDGRLNIISNAGTTPNYAAVEFNIWYLPTETFDDIRQEIETYLGHVAALDPWLREHPLRFTWKLNEIFYPPCETSPDHPLVRDLSEALRVQRLPAEVAAFGAASELTWYAEAGVGGTLFGPGAVEQAHSPNEFVELSEVVAAAKCLSRAISTFCGQEIDQAAAS